MYLSSYITFLSPFLGYSNPQLDKDKDDTVVIVAATLAAVLFIAIIVLGVVLFLRRRKRQSHGNLLVTTGHVNDINNFYSDCYFLLLALYVERIQSPKRLPCNTEKGFPIYPSEIKPPSKTCLGTTG